jgi:hypothetical protein
MLVKEMIECHPDVRGDMNAQLVAAIVAAYRCAQACTSCADACLAEPRVAELRQCIRTNLDCATICAATGEAGSRRAGANEAILRQLVELCAAACRACAEECEQHAEMHEHCRLCAEACRSCEKACAEAAPTIGH